MTNLFETSFQRLEKSKNLLQLFLKQGFFLIPKLLTFVKYAPEAHWFRGHVDYTSITY